MKFDSLKEYKIRNTFQTFLEKSCENFDGETSPRPFSRLKYISGATA